jgi:hypothetical protein
MAQGFLCDPIGNLAEVNLFSFATLPQQQASATMRRVRSSAATNGQLAELFADLIGHAIDLTVPLAIGFVKQLPLRPARVVKTLDSKAE